VTAAQFKRVSLSNDPVQQTLNLELVLRTPLVLAPDRKSRSKEQVVLPITTHISLTRGVACVDVQTRVDNRASDHRLRVHFPAPFAAVTGHHNGHFELVER